MIDVYGINISVQKYLLDDNGRGIEAVIHEQLQQLQATIDLFALSTHEGNRSAVKTVTMAVRVNNRPYPHDLTKPFPNPDEEEEDSSSSED